MKPRLPASAACWLALATACSSSTTAPSMAGVDFGRDIRVPEAEVLRGAPQLELLALDPQWPTAETQEDPASFHGYGVLGRAVVTDGATRVQLLDAIGRACRENDGTVAACFNPRHGVRATSSLHTVDLVICFECLSFQVFVDGVRANHGDLAATQEPEVSAIFRAAGIAIAPR